MMARLILFVAAVVLVAMLLTGGFREGPLGPSTTASIEALEADPGQWERKQVRVTGTVGQRIAVAGFGGFVLTDEAGREILVVGQANPASPGQPMTVEGQFVTAFVMGEMSMPAIIVGAD
ncbi:hypothetical protein SPO2722 [Ruegeria pomeroyi DSS-3]|uniref:Uncharacterized protein n=2 Tax=Ruegeria pomeroyi TaxID=89184 RepID=Q5LPX4_RUEPO|nr:hypothetical protein SPO2722 [Ruegeria pomeroyi DSS-3]